MHVEGLLLLLLLLVLLGLGLTGGRHHSQIELSFLGGFGRNGWINWILLRLGSWGEQNKICDAEFCRGRGKERVVFVLCDVRSDDGRSEIWNWEGGFGIGHGKMENSSEGFLCTVYLHYSFFSPPFFLFLQFIMGKGVLLKKKNYCNIFLEFF